MPAMVRDVEGRSEKVGAVTMEMTEETGSGNQLVSSEYSGHTAQPLKDSECMEAHEWRPLPATIPSNNGEDHNDCTGNGRR